MKNETFISMVHMAISLLAGRSLQQSALSMRRNDRGISAKFWAKGLSWVSLALCLSCLATKSQASQTDDLDSAIGGLEQQVDVTTTAGKKAGDLLNQTNATQSALFVGSIMTAHAGDTVSFPITLIPGPVPISALQADVLLSSGISIVSMTAGAAALDAGKTVSFSGNPSNPVLVFGINRNTIGDGVVVIVTLKLDPSLGAGLYPVIFSNPVASGPDGKSLPMCVTSGIVEVN